MKKEQLLKNCLVRNINYVNGYIEECVLGIGTITLGGAEEAHFLDCWSGVVGSATPIIDMGGSGQGLGVRNYNGGLKIINKTGDEKVSIDLNSGQVVLDSTITAGEIVVRGIGKLTDNSESGTSVDFTHLLTPETFASAIWDDTETHHQVVGSFGHALARIKGLVQENYRVLSINYDANNNVTSSTFRVYANASDCNNNVNPLGTYAVTATYDAQGRTETYKVVKA